MRRICGVTIPPIILLFASVRGEVIVDTAVGGKLVDGVPANQVDLVYPEATVTAPDGSIYFSETFRHVIRRIRPDGILETLAGTGVSAYSGDGGPAVQASLYFPADLAIDRSGNLYVNDSGNSRLRVIDTAGIIRTLAGTGIPASQVSEGPAALAQIDRVSGLAVDKQGTLYFSEPGRVRRINGDGRIELVAGAEQTDPFNPASDGDGGPAVYAHMRPGTIAISPSGELLILESSKIRRVGVDGIISTIAGTGELKYPSFGVPDTGPEPALQVRFGRVISMAVGPVGEIYVSEYIGDQIAHIRRISSAGLIETVAGTSNPVVPRALEGAAREVFLYTALGLSADASGFVYFSDTVLGRVLSLSPQGVITALAGADPAAAPDGSPARETWLANPVAIKFDRNDVLYIAERAGCRIRRISTEGKLETVAGTGQCSPNVQNGPAAMTDLPLPADLTVLPNGDIYVATGFGAVFRISVQRQIELVENVKGVRLASDSRGRIYFLDIDTGIGRLIPGNVPEDYVSSTGLVRARIPHVDALAVDPVDNLCFSSYGAGGQSTLYRVTPEGQLTSSPLIGYDSPSLPTTLAVDAADVRYFVSNPYLVRNNGFQSASIIGVFGFRGDAGPALSARANGVTSVTLNRKGELYFLDSGSRRVRFLTGAPPSRKPVINLGGVVNAASRRAGPIAFGEQISVFVQSDTESSGVSTIENNQLPVVLGNVQVLFDGYYPAQITRISANQIDVFVPYFEYGPGNPPPATMDVSVSVDGVRSDPVRLILASTAIGLYSADDSGAGQGKMLNQDGSDNGANNPAERGSVISFSGTGAGLIQPALPSGATVISTPYPKPRAPVAVTIGGKQADLLYAGAAAGSLAGILQIKVRIPLDVEPGDVPIFVTVGQSTSQDRLTVRVK